MTDDFEKRMDNWRRTVTWSGGGAGCCCASWAELYIKSRAKDGNGNNPAPPCMIITVDELDGWLIEAAVRSMIDFNEKMALRYWYVRQYPEHWIRAKLMLRSTAVRLVLARAQNNLCKVLDKLDIPDIILFNNLHAGVDPRPESDAKVASLALGKKKALIE